MTDSLNQVPSDIRLHTGSATLEVCWGEKSAQFPYEFLRVLSPSAEVQGHGQPILQTGKRLVKVRNIEPVGNYGIKLSFDDGHDTGIYSWGYLQELADHQEERWEAYLTALEQAGASRDSAMIGSWKQD